MTERGLDAALLVALGLIGVAVAAVQLPNFVALHDEGLVVQAAARIADGDWPYRDFWWNYGPGQPGLLAAFEPLTGGPSLLVWRIVRALTDTGIALLAFVLMRRHLPLLWALAAWAATLLLLVVARLPHPNATVTLLALAAIALARHPRLAGALAGVSLLFRPELGVAVVAAAALAAPARRGAVVATAAAVGALLWLPFVVAAGPVSVLEHTLWADLTVLREQRLPLWRSPPDGADLLDLLHHALPALLLAGSVAAVAAALVLARGGRAQRELVGLLPLLAVGVLYLAGRADIFHLVPLAGLLPAALALVAGAAPRAPVAVACGVLMALLLIDGATRRFDVVGLDTDGLAAAPGPAGDGVRMGAADARALATIQAELDRRAPGRAIWVGNARHDRMTSGATAAYVLLDRRPATRYDILQPGVVTSEEVQREMVEDLHARDAPVVQWLSPFGAVADGSPAAEENGARVLDRALARSYRPVFEANGWRLSMPR